MVVVVGEGAGQWGQGQVVLGEKRRSTQRVAG